MNELARRPLPRMTADEFLAWPGDGSARRFQLVDGEVRAISLASRIHGAIQANLAFLAIAAVRSAGLQLQVLTEAAIVPMLQAGDNVRVPDLVVGPEDDVRGDQVMEAPVLIAEILSPGNADGTRDNLRAYATLPTLREILVVHSSRVEAEVFSRTDAGVWPPAPQLVRAGGMLRLETLRLVCVVDDVYTRTWLTRRPREL
jgi:Uma2 family endonuclease